MQQLTIWDIEERVYPVEIKGLCDDPYCPKCNYWLDDPKPADYERCPECGARIDFGPWHRVNGR